ncbi:MAG TPA: membrane protein insertase YidC [Phycisphaerae bacterium]|nr:membrane protein insertase YidC [Phycisphaerae bacterium]
MDTKKLLSSMLFAAALMMVFFYFTKGGFGGGSTPPKPSPIFGPIVRHFQPREPGATPDTITLGDATKGDDKFSVKVDPATAGIDLIQLNVKNFAANYKRTEPLTLTPLNMLPEQAKPFSTMGIHIFVASDELRLPFIGYPANASGDQIYAANATAIFDTQFLWKAGDKKESPTESQVDLTMTVNDTANVPVARIVKTFHLDKTSYELTVTHSIYNLIAPHRVKKPAADKVIDLGQKNIANVVVRVGNARKDSGKDYTLDAAAGTVSVVPGGTIQPADTLDIDFHLPTDTITARIDQFASAEMNRDDPQTDDRFFHGVRLLGAKIDYDHGYNLTHNELRKATATGGTVVAGPGGQFNDFAKDPQLWIASANRFFTIVTRPLPEHVAPVDAPRVEAPAAKAASVRPAYYPTVPIDGGHNIDKPTHIASANIDLMTVGLKAPDDAAIIRLTGNAVAIPPGSVADEPLTVYMGPKDRKILEGNITAPEGSREYNFAVYGYIKLIQFQQGCYQYCIKDFVLMPILSTLDFLKDHVAFGNYGIAIMILVVIVRALLHPLTRASQINMAKMAKKMRDVQPKLEAVKKKYADDKRKQSEETMRIYKENNVNPAGGIMGCLPMFIQMPIWAALYSGLRNDIDLRHAPFIPGWINDLASPDYVFPHTIPTLGHPAFSVPLLGDIYALNLLPILLAGVFFIQMKVSTASQPKATDPQQAQMQKMSQYMIFIFPLFLYNAPSGLNLYIFASTMAGLLDTWLVRKSLKKQGILPASAPALPTHEEK